MRNLSELLDFLTQKMSMTDLYQPAIILHLLVRGGASSKQELSRTLSGYDMSVQEYYEKVLMRWPKITLTHHNVVVYNQKSKTFALNFSLDDAALVEQAKDICDQKIREWIAKKAAKGGSSTREVSKRYRVLKAARGKCELCGISAKISPIEVDHIVPQSTADKKRYIIKDGFRMHVDDEKNLQALCFRCNRAKRDQDSTDFRLPKNRIIRDGAVEYTVGSASSATIVKLTGDQLLVKLFDKLTEEHARLLDTSSGETVLEKAVDMIEVLLSVSKASGYTEDQVFNLIRQKRDELGGFDGTYLID